MLLQSDEISGKSCHKWSNCRWLPLFAFRTMKLRSLGMLNIDLSALDVEKQPNEH